MDACCPSACRPNLLVAGRTFADPQQLAALRLWGWCRAPVDDAAAVDYFFEWRDRRREQLRELRPLISSIRARAAAAQAAKAAEQQQLHAAKSWLYDSYLASLDSPCTCLPDALTPTGGLCAVSCANAIVSLCAAHGSHVLRTAAVL